LLGPEPVATGDDGSVALTLPRAATEDELLDAWQRGRRRLPAPRAVIVQVARGHDFPWQYAGSFDRPRATVVLPPDETFDLELVGLDGAGIAGAMVGMRPASPALRVEPSFAFPGMFRVSGVPHGRTVALCATAPGHAPAVMQVTLPAQRNPIRMTLLPSFAADIVVRDHRGVGVANAVVSVELAPPRRHRHAGAQWRALAESPVRLGRTDDSGHLRAEGMWDTEMRLSASHERLGSAKTGELVPVPGQPIVLVLDAPATIQGLLIDGDVSVARRHRVEAAYVPPADPRSAPELDRQLGTHETLTNADGTFALPRLPPADWELRVLDPEVPEWSSLRVASRPLTATRITTAAGQDQHLTIDLRAGRRPREAVLTGALTLTGEGAAGARVELRALPDDIKDETDGRARPALAITRADALGRFAFHDVAPGRACRLTFQVRHAGTWWTLARHWVELRAADGTPLRPDVRCDVATAPLVLGLFDHDGRAFARRMVDVVRTDDPASAITLVADETGTIELPYAPLGRYRIAIRGDARGTPVLRDAEIEVQAGRGVFRDLHASGVHSSSIASPYEKKR
jgi:hypothetical protein